MSAGEGRPGERAAGSRAAAGGRDPGRLRVLFVVGNFVAGGAERHLLELWSRMDRERFSIEIACLRREGQFLAAVEALGWPLHDLRAGRRIYGPAAGAALLRLIAIARRFRPHVIHGYLFGPNLLAVLAGRATGTRVVAVAKRNLDSFETPRQAAVQRFVHRGATHVTAVSEAVAATVEAMGVPRSRITVIPNGVDTARFGIASGDRDALGVGNARPLVGSVGSLAARKDYGTLIEALEQLKMRGRSFAAVLIGDGPERPALEARVRERGLADRVKFLGERSDVERLLPMMDLFVLSSREEGIPNALLEAMAAGRPTVATAVGGTPEVLRDGETGWLVPAGSPGRLADALEDALMRPDEARRRGDNARRWAEQHLGIAAMVRAHERFYALASSGDGP
ncbi:MAG: glycosyltransferase [Candidatus Eisenbacteria bacterium]|nr:glycosyltransferase [Candidatus Eisenbacteria bacterium]